VHPAFAKALKRRKGFYSDPLSWFFKPFSPINFGEKKDVK